MNMIDSGLEKALTAVGEAAARQEPSTVLVAALAASIRGSAEATGALGTVAFLTEEPVRETLLNTVVPMLPWAAEADYFLLIAPSGKAFEVDPSHTSVTTEDFEDISSQPCGAVTFAGSPSRLLTGTPSAEVIRARANLLTSSALLGASRAAYELTRDYVRTRKQFGKPLVAIAAVASNLARMHVALMQAGASVNRARELDRDPAGGRSALAAATVARGATADAGTEVAGLAHQLHGAIGITADYPLQYLTRRIWALRDSFGPAADAVEQLGQAVLDGGETALWEIVTRPA